MGQGYCFHPLLDMASMGALDWPRFETGCWNRWTFSLIQQSPYICIRPLWTDPPLTETVYPIVPCAQDVQYGAASSLHASLLWLARSSCETGCWTRWSDLCSDPARLFWSSFVTSGYPVVSIDYSWVRETGIKPDAGRNLSAARTPRAETRKLASRFLHSA